MSVLPTNTTVIPRRLAPTRSEVLPVHAKQATPELVNHVPISTNVRPMNMTAIQMLLVQTRLVATLAHVTQAMTAPVLLAPIITSVL